MKTLRPLIGLMLFAGAVWAGTVPRVLPLRTQATVLDTWLTQRLETILPEIMRREQIDMWLVISREYNEDPVFLSLVPAHFFSSRRLSMLLFFDRGEKGIEKAVIARYGIPPLYQPAWAPDQTDQWECLARAVRQRQPKKIGINEGATFAFGDGISAFLKDKLRESLGPEYARRLVSAERLAVGWLERRLPEELETYPRIVSIAHAIIREVFSAAAITPGVTTCEDLVWLFREKSQKNGLPNWFQPTVDIQRHGPIPDGPNPVIRRGDLLHCDFGFQYLHLNTDIQELAYILKDDEQDAPEGLRAAIKTGNRLQDILTDEFRTGRSGNQILLSALGKMKQEKIMGSIYSHPLGLHGHAAGPTIGLWDHQAGIPGAGDYPLFPDTCYAIELNVRATVPEWGGQEVRIGLEEDAVFSGHRVVYLDDRQTRLILVK